jgi:hypothetical protein
VTQAKWVVLEGCDCAGAWAPHLAALLHVLPAMSPNYNFRLWLTAPADSVIPAVLLAPCTKITLRQPSGGAARYAQHCCCVAMRVARCTSAGNTPDAFPEGQTARAVRFFEPLLNERRTGCRLFSLPGTVHQAPCVHCGTTSA